MLNKQKMVDMMKSLKKQETVNEFWKTATPEQRESVLDKIVMQFDLTQNRIVLQSSKKNVNGDPLFEWTLDADTGEIIESTRQEDASSERIVERQVNPESLENAEVKKALAVIEANKPDLLKKDTTPKNDEEASSADDAASMSNLDMQRDMAFKIVYFFIVFIVATFGLLYAYFQMNKKELEEEEQRLAIKHRVRSKGSAQSEQTFFDFLAGNLDEEHYNINPYAMRENLSTRSSHREDSGFGSGNLETLENTRFYQQ
jgi:hypothetical protein